MACLIYHEIIYVYVLKFRSREVVVNRLFLSPALLFFLQQLFLSLCFALPCYFDFFVMRFFSKKRITAPIIAVMIEPVTVFGIPFISGCSCDAITFAPAFTSS